MAEAAAAIRSNQMADGQAARSEQEVLDGLRVIADKLEREADRRVGLRTDIEKRWLADTEQYHGKYDADTKKELDGRQRSKLFINMTRSKTNAVAAKLGDMLFPTDDRNWGIEPTPVPSLAANAAEAVKTALAAKEQAAQAPEGSPHQQQASHVADKAGRIAADLQATIDEARKRARAMADEIDDQLREARYQTTCRRIIEDACKLGTGVIKGPVISDKRPQRWSKSATNDNGQSAEMYQLSPTDDRRATFLRVDPWSFFPDPDASCMEESQGEFERHLLNEKQLRQLAGRRGFNQDAIRRLLREKSRDTSLNYLNDLRSITGSGQTDTNKRYKVWEYHGPIEADDVLTLIETVADETTRKAMASAEIDPLSEVNVVLWFCQGEVLRFGLYPMDSGESIYSVFNIEKAEASIFGYGIPYLMRDSQSALNAAWRLMMDNGGIASGPNIVINKDLIEPEDNDSYEIGPWKRWIRKSGPPNVPAFESYEFNSHQNEMAAIIQAARQFMDDETNVSQIAQGEQGTHTTQTAQGMSILMNATNTVFRRIVKNWDDDLTTPTIRRIYDWNMQFSDKEEIKGDYDVDARGSSVLLVREMQSQSLMAIALSFAGHPVFGAGIKPFPLLRRLMQAQMLPADEIVKTDEEMAQEQANQQPAPDPEIMKIEAIMNVADIEAQSRERVAMIERETALIKMAEQGNLEMDKLMQLLADKDRERQNRLDQKRIDTNSKERIFAAEAAMTPPAAEPGGGYL